MTYTPVIQQSVINTCQLGPNPPLLDVFDADGSHEPFVALARNTLTITQARVCAMLAAVALDRSLVMSHE